MEGGSDTIIHQPGWSVEESVQHYIAAIIVRGPMGLKWANTGVVGEWNDKRCLIMLTQAINRGQS